MKQLGLFPPESAIEKPLPQDVLLESVSLLAELLAAVLEQATQEPSRVEGRRHE